MILNATLENQFFILNDSIEHVIEYCKNSFEKIKSTIKKTDYEFLEKVNAHLKKISAILWENKKLLNDELKCFIEIEHYIIYIMFKIPIIIARLFEKNKKDTIFLLFPICQVIIMGNSVN